MVLGTLIVAGAASCTMALVMLGVPLLSGPMVEAPVPDGPWSFAWGPSSVAPSVEQQQQVRALRMVAGAAAALVSILCVLTIAGLWRQRLMLRRQEYFVHWALGARKLQIAARLLGEARAWAGAAMAIGLIGAAAVVGFVDRAFPGAVPVTPNLAAAATMLSALAVTLVRWESRAGGESHGTNRSRLWEVVASPPMIGAIGFAALSGVGLLALHAPYTRIDEAGMAGAVGTASLALVPRDRGDVVLEWTRVTRDGGMVAGFASAGATRGAGRRDHVTVQCGECFEGLFYMPLKIVSAEIHAVAPDTFAHLGMSVFSGRDFDDALDRGALDAAIVSRALAARHFEGGNPLGRRLKVGQSGWATVIGVVDGADGYVVYLPLAQAWPTDIEVLAATPATLQAVLGAAPAGTEIGAVRSRAEVYSTHRWFRRLLNATGAMALAVLGAGLWISAANEAGAARHEIAVRRAVGATRRSFWTFYVRFAGCRLAFALAVGAWLSLFLGAGLEAAYASTPRTDWRVWCVVAFWISIVYVLGSVRLMARASKDPLTGALESAA
jgi:hypothetical protein